MWGGSLDCVQSAGGGREGFTCPPLCGELFCTPQHSAQVLLSTVACATQLLLHVHFLQ